jgi:tetratricopeptide (TPR) repeat protein
VDLADQAAFAALHEKMLPIAEALDANLLARLHRSLGWALNSLGNAHAQQDDHAAAVKTYTGALSHAPDNAMLYRNRAGEYLELGQLDEAQADIEQATALEPDAERLPHLRQALAEKTNPIE